MPNPGAGKELVPGRLTVPRVWLKTSHWEPVFLFVFPYIDVYFGYFHKNFIVFRTLTKPRKVLGFRKIHYKKS